MTQRFTLETAKEVADKIVKSFSAEMFAYRQDRENYDYAKVVRFSYNPLNKRVIVEYGKLTFCGYVDLQFN